MSCRKVIVRAGFFAQNSIRDSLRAEVICREGIRCGRESGATADEGDLLRSRLDQIIGMRHPLVALARKLDWAFIEKTFGEIYSDGPGQPTRPTRLMAGLIILKCAHDLSDEVLCASTG